jgi:hypothetical protein
VFGDSRDDIIHPAGMVIADAETVPVQPDIHAVLSDLSSDLFD